MTTMMRTMTTGTIRTITAGTKAKVGRRLAGLAMLAVTLPLAGCFRHTIQVGEGAPRGEVVYDHWQNFWIGGLIGDSREDVDQICPSGDATIRARQSFLNALVAGLTAGIYMPTTLEVRCRRTGRRGELELSAEALRDYAQAPGFDAWVAAESPAHADGIRRALADR